MASRPVLVPSATVAGVPVPERLARRVRVVDLSQEDALSKLQPRAADGCTWTADNSGLVQTRYRVLR